MSHSHLPPAPPRSLLGWRLLALVYDLWPALALWLLAALLFTLAHTFIGGHDVHRNIAPFSLLSWLLWASCWGLTGLYATLSWRRGGQTLGMRPWRLRLCGADGGRASWPALWLRYLVGSVSLLSAGLGFWWAWIDREHLTWHDRLSATRLYRQPRQRHCD